MLISTHVEQDEIQPGVFRNTINLRAIGHRQNGSLLRAFQDWEDSGDGTMPHAVTRSPLRIRTANDSRRRFFPVPGDDSKWLEIGQPFIKLSGTWTQVSLGTPTRTGKTITWTRPQTITTVTHGIHFVKLEIELRGGFVPEDGMMAFPVGLQGLTRQGVNILDGGNIVANLRPFIIFDAANEQDIRPIAHSFVNINGPYLLLTLPSLTGMTRPVIDPTLTLQPNATDGVDNYMDGGGFANSNYGNATTMLVGDQFSGAIESRGLIKFDLSSLPASAIVSAATFSLFESSANDALGLGSWQCGLRRILVDWHETQSTWNNRLTATPWTTAGCSSDGNDRAASDTASLTLDGTAAAAFVNWTSATLADDVQKMRNGTYTNYGWLIQSPSTALAGGTAYNVFSSSDHATAANRPKLVITYTLPGGVPLFMASYRRRRG